VNAVALSLHSPGALAGALRAGGVEAGDADSAASGATPLAVRFTGLGQTTLEALVRHAGKLGLDLSTGEDWAIVAGSRARLSTLAQPFRVPAELAELALALATAMPHEPATAWEVARGTLRLDRPLIAGILNLTPDSFSDGGHLASLDVALRHAEQLVEDGARMLDVGGESTRPGRTAIVPDDEELRRVLPVIERLAAEFPDVPVAIDTVKASVAKAALDAGAAVVNDVSGLRFDPDMAPVVARAGAGLVLMHSRGEHLELASYAHARYDDGVVGAVLGELRAGIDMAVSAGIPLAAVAVDPGLGFGKTTAQSLALLDQLRAFLALGRPVYLGPSRKRFLGDVCGRPAAERDGLTAVACALAWERGARIFRVHDVRQAADALALATALEPSSHPA
jgi:dihydropteroate synthase